MRGGMNAERGFRNAELDESEISNLKSRISDLK